VQGAATDPRKPPFWGEEWRGGGGRTLNESILACSLRARSSIASLSMPRCRFFLRACRSSTVSAFGFTDACVTTPTWARVNEQSAHAEELQRHARWVRSSSLSRGPWHSRLAACLPTKERAGPTRTSVCPVRGLVANERNAQWRCAGQLTPAYSEWAAGQEAQPPLRHATCDGRSHASSA
jgi:hypothetical protein